jgi:predicted  nucleic acid-binding Zn-ribbon protein
MNSVMGSLKELHQIHIQPQDVQEQIARGPRQANARAAFTAKKQAEADAAKDALKKAKMTADQKALQLKTNEAKIADLKGKLNMASSNRVFDIIRSQIDADTMANSVLEDEILEALETVDRMQVAAGKAQQEVDQAKLEQDRITKEVAAADPKLQQTAEELSAHLKAAESHLPGTILEVYRRLVQAHGASALASVENKACTACFAILSSNSLIELNTGKTHFCRSCGRLLYLPTAD